METSMSLRFERTEPKSTGCTLQLRPERPDLSCIGEETSMSLRFERTEPKSTGCTLQLRPERTGPKLYKQEGNACIIRRNWLKK